MTTKRLSEFDENVEIVKVFFENEDDISTGPIVIINTK